MSLLAHEHPLLKNHKRVKYLVSDLVISNPRDVNDKIRRIKDQVDKLSDSELRILSQYLWLKSREAYFQYKNRKYSRSKRLELLQSSKELSELANTIERRLENK